MNIHKAINIILIIGMIMMVCMPIVNAIQTDKIYVGETGIIGGYPTYDYDAQRGSDYIVWTRSIDIYDSIGNVNPDGDTSDIFDPSWIMVHQVSTGESWNITPDYDAGLKISPNYYYHSQSVSIDGSKILYEVMYGNDDWEKTLYMHNITTNETWHIPHGTLSAYTSGHDHQIHGDWIYFTHYGGGGRYIYVYNYITGEGRRIDGGALDNGNLGINDDFMWFTDRTGTPDIMKIYGLENGKLTQIDGTNIGASIYGCNKASYNDRYLGITLKIGTDYDSYIIDLEGMNITDDGGDVTIYWENIASENIIEVDTEDSYDSFAPYTDGYYAIYQYTDNNNDIMIYNIGEDRKTYFASSNNDEILTDFTGSTILYNSNINSFTHNNDATDDYDIYRSLSDTENMANSFITIVPIVILIIFGFVIVGVFSVLGNNSGYGGML